MKINTRALHRDLGYFYIGLIISFAFSGIMMNHRDNWHPEKYTVSNYKAQVTPIFESNITDSFIKAFVPSTLKIKDKVKRHFIKKENLRINCENTEIEIELKTGKAEITEFKKTPIVSQLMFLHKGNSVWWIYYSDIFAASLITIAISGMLMYTKGQFSFKVRGWKLDIAGLIFPIIFLLIFS